MAEPPKTVIALDGTRIERVLDSAVEIVEATPGDRAFPDRVTNSLGLCLKLGSTPHGVKADGRALVYPPHAVCVRPPGCIWSTASTGRVGFLSIDIEPSLLPGGRVDGAMCFESASRLPDLRYAARVLRSTASRLQKDSLVAELVDGLVRGALLRSSDLGREPAPGAAERARELLESRLEAPPTLQHLAEAVGGNRFVLLRQFRRRFGLPPHAFVLRLRVERARFMLARGAEVAEVAAALGFADQSHMSRAFKRVVGLSPRQYQRLVRLSH
jgi:AraC-like DNA-binding protein